MARTLQRQVTPLSREEVETLFVQNDAAIEALSEHLDDANASHREADAAVEQLGARLIRLSRLETRLRNVQKRMSFVLGEWFTFFVGRSVLQRILRISTLQTHRIDQATDRAKLELDSARGQLGHAKECISAARVSFGRTDIPKIVQAGRDAHGRADQLSDVVGLLGALTSAGYTASNTDCEGYYREFEGLLANEYRAFASRESYPQEADAYVELKEVALRLGELRLAPRLAKRNICAVAGGFSSGKSSFLNALIGGDEDILPTQITPTTSIPTYIFHVDAALSVNAFNHYGGAVAIDANMFQQMTHDFKRDHGVELKRLVHRVSIYTPALSSWGNLALIDTPGYTNPENNAAGGTHSAAERDEDIALANVLKSPFLIWVVDCEKGTLPDQDIHFIRKFVDKRGEGGEDRLYLVLNKGDKKTEQQREDILRVAAETAKTHAIPFAGIGIYSSHEREWYANQGLSFDAFLQTVNEAQSSSTSGLEQAVQAVFQQYIDYHKQESEQLGKASGLLNRLALVLSHQEGSLEKLDADLKKRRNYIRKTRTDHENLREEAKRLQERFAAAVRGFAENIGARS